MENIITIIFIILFLLAALSGWRRGMLRDGRRLIGVLLGLLAIPVVSPSLEKLILSLPIFTSLGNNLVINYIASYFIRIAVFSIVMTISGRIVFMLINIESLPSAFTLVDRVLGIFWSGLKLCVVVWLFETLFSMSPTISIGLINTLRSNEIWQTIAAHNILPTIFASVLH